VYNGPLLSRVVLTATSASVPVGSNFSVQMNIVGDLGSAPRRCSQPQFSGDLTECMTIGVTVSGSQFSNTSVSVVEQQTSRLGYANAEDLLVPNVAMTLGSKRKVTQEVVGMDGHITFHPDEEEEMEGVVSYGKKVHVVVDGRIHTRFGSEAMLETSLDHSLIVLPDTVVVTGLTGDVTTRSDNVVVVNFPAIAGSDSPSSLSVSFDAMVLPNFDGVVRMDNRAVLSNGKFSVELPEEGVTMNVRGIGRRSIKEHNERKAQVLSGGEKSFFVVFGAVFGVFGVLLGVLAVVIRRRTITKRRVVSDGVFERDD